MRTPRARATFMRPTLASDLMVYICYIEILSALVAVVEEWRHGIPFTSKRGGLLQP